MMPGRFESAKFNYVIDSRTDNSGFSTFCLTSVKPRLERCRRVLVAIAAESKPSVFNTLGCVP